MARFTLAVSGLNASENPAPGVGVARSLLEDPDLDLRLVGLVYDALEPGAYLDWLFSKSYLMPYPSGGKDAFLSRLAHLAQRESVDFCLPTLDLEIPLYIRYADEIKAMGLKTWLPEMGPFKERGKDQLQRLAQVMGLKVPQTEMVTSPQELEEACEKEGFPLLIKGAFYQATEVWTMPQALAAYHSIVAIWGYPVLVQERIEGEEVNLVGVGDGEGGSLGEVAIKKMSVTKERKIWSGVTIHQQSLSDASSAFLGHYRWRGAYEIECLVRDEALYLIEINPRFPAWTYFATGVGVNLPARMVKAAMGIDPGPNPSYAPGKLFMRYTYECIKDLKEFQNLTLHGET
ncbi:MAG: ATP-grasp domain-containing protein [bacterium]|nr:ATP-grasp domain-containing protein [bacterium]